MSADPPRQPSEDDGSAPMPPLRSGAWPRQVRVEIVRIENWLAVALVGRESCPRSTAVAVAVRAHLADAGAIIHRRNRRISFAGLVDWWRGTSIEQAFRSLHAARVFLVQLVSEEAVDALVPGVVARVQSCLPATDPQRIEIEKLPGMTTNRAARRAVLIHALEVGYEVHDEAHTRVRRFRNVILSAAVLISLITSLFVTLVAFNPTAVPLCFRPDITTAQAATLTSANGQPATDQRGNSRLVCPSAEQALEERQPQAPTSRDIWIVAALGLLGGGLASAVAVRKMVSTTTPYDVPLALALLKVPSGALTAIAGILLLGGGFVPGLSELDSQRQILAYALLFGYGQQVATRYLDERASTLLSAVPSKATRTPQTPSLPSSTPPAPDEVSPSTVNGTRPASPDSTRTRATTP